MRVYRDAYADLAMLKGRQIAVIGCGNQGRAQALNLRDSGLNVVVRNRQDTYAERAREDGFTPLSIEDAAQRGDVVMLLLPDEVAPDLYTAQIAPHLAGGKTLVFASSYNVAFGFVEPPPRRRRGAGRTAHDRRWRPRPVRLGPGLSLLHRRGAR